METGAASVFKKWDAENGCLVDVSEVEGLRAERDFWKGEAERNHNWVHRLEDEIARLREEKP